jgi:hypothetical protein
MSGKGSLDLLTIRKLALNENRPGINSAPMAFTQVVEDNNFMPVIQQELRANAPDIACAANHEDFHWRGKCSVIGSKSKATRRRFSAGYRTGGLPPVANLNSKDARKYFARRLCFFSFRELQPSFERNCVCNVVQELSNFLPPNPIAKCRCRHSEHPSLVPRTGCSYKDR